jgi:hypothetical protein
MRGENLRDLPDELRCTATVTNPRSKNVGQPCPNHRMRNPDGGYFEQCAAHRYVPQRASRLNSDPLAALESIPDSQVREEERARAIELAIAREERRTAATDAARELEDRGANLLVHPDDLSKVRSIEKVVNDPRTSVSLRAHLRPILDQLRRGERLEGVERVPGMAARIGGSYDPLMRMVEEDRTELHDRTPPPRKRAKQPVYERSPSGGVYLVGYR